jgi:hypothetical protein
MKNYFEVEETKEETPHRIHIKCGENARVVLIETAEGFVVDVFRITDDELLDTMCVWNDDIFDDGRDFTDDLSEDDQPDIPTAEEIKKFFSEWGQKHKEICANLDYNPTTSDDLLMEDYFWVESRKEWFPKITGIYTKREQEIADHLRANP